jgi:hypothetical protein
LGVGDGVDVVVEVVVVDVLTAAPGVAAVVVVGVALGVAIGVVVVVVVLVVVVEVLARLFLGIKVRLVVVRVVVLVSGVDCALLAVVEAGDALVESGVVPGALVRDALLRFNGKLIPTKVPSKIATATANMMTAISLFIFCSPV